MRDYAGGFGVSLPVSRPSYGHGPFVMPFAALIYAMTRARIEGMRVAYLDAQAEDLDLERLDTAVAACAPAVIVSAVSLPSLREDLAILHRLKERTGAAVVACGAACRVVPDDVLADGAADVAVCGDLEVLGPDLLRALLDGDPPGAVPGVAVRGGGERDGGRLTDASLLPIPALDLIPLDKYRTWQFGLSKRFLNKEYGTFPRYYPIYVSRGCPHGCSYCPYPVGFGKRMVKKSIEQAVAEFAAVAEAGTHKVIVRDQTISDDLDLLAAFCSALTAEDLEMEWQCEVRVGSLSPSLMRDMRRAGCVGVYYGVESGDPRIFSKEAKRGLRYADIAKSLQDTAEAGMKPSCHFLVGFPDETWESVGRTVDLIGSLGVTAGDCAILTPYPGTPIYDRMRAEGRLVSTDWSDFTGCDPVMRLEHMSPVEVRMARWYVMQAIRANRTPGLRRRFRLAADALNGRPDAEGREVFDLLGAEVGSGR